MKNYNLFFSWQSDIKQNDSFISDCLQAAISLIEDEKITYTIDRDTLNQRGTPDIPNTVFNKIANEVDIFITDITIINSNTPFRPTPNPNVLLELGYAAATISWENIICVINSHYGSPERLPFDIRYRKPIEFDLPETSTQETRNNEKKKVTDEFQKLLLSLNPNEKRYRLREIAHILHSDQWRSIGNHSNDNKDYGSLTITHEVDNIFYFDFISRNEPGSGDWHGQMHLSKSFFNTGRISYELKSRNSFGLKEFFIREDSQYYYIMIFPINLQERDHGREVFRRSKKSSK